MKKIMFIAALTTLSLATFAKDNNKKPPRRSGTYTSPCGVTWNWWISCASCTNSQMDANVNLLVQQMDAACTSGTTSIVW